jgi:hypothetical protein
MIGHLAAPMRAALGEMPAESKASPLRYWPLNKLVIYGLPWPPKGGDWELCRADLTKVLDRFVAHGPGGK